MKWRASYAYSYVAGLAVLVVLAMGTMSLPPTSEPMRKIREQARAHADEAYGVRP